MSFVVNNNGQTNKRTTPSQHGCYTWKGHQARNTGAEVPFQPRLPLSAKPSTSARSS